MRAECDSKLAQVVYWARQVLDMHNKVTAKLAEKFATNPANALEWGQEYFQHGADYGVATHVKAMFEGGVTTEDMRQDFIRTALHSASRHSRSTSPTSNLVADYKMEAEAKVAKMLNGMW